MFKSLKKLIKNLLIHTQNIPDFVAFAFYFKRGVNLYLYSFIKNRVIAMSQLRNCIILQLSNSFILFHSMGCGLLSPLVPRGGNWAVLLLAHGHAQAPPGGNPPPGQVLLNTALCWCPPARSTASGRRHRHWGCLLSPRGVLGRFRAEGGVQPSPRDPELVRCG